MKIKKIFSGLIILVMIMSLVPASVSAERLRDYDENDVNNSLSIRFDEITIEYDDELEDGNENSIDTNVKSLKTFTKMIGIASDNFVSAYDSAVHSHLQDLKAGWYILLIFYSGNLEITVEFNKELIQTVNDIIIEHGIENLEAEILKLLNAQGFLSFAWGGFFNKVIEKSKEAIKQTASDIVRTTENVYEATKSTIDKAKDKAKSTFNKVADKIEEKIPETAFIRKSAGAIISNIPNLRESAIDIGKNLVARRTNYVKSAFDIVQTKLPAARAINYITQHSDDLGGALKDSLINAGDNVKEFIDDNSPLAFSNVLDFSKDALKDGISALTNPVSTALDFADQAFDYIKDTSVVDSLISLSGDSDDLDPDTNTTTNEYSGDIELDQLAMDDEIELSNGTTVNNTDISENPSTRSFGFLRTLVGNSKLIILVALILVLGIGVFLYLRSQNKLNFR